MTEQLLTVAFEEGRESFLSTQAISDLQQLAKRIITEDIQDVNVFYGDEVQGLAVYNFLYLEGVNKNNLRTTEKVGNVVVEIEGNVPSEE
jgi:hypothetical protein